MKSLSFVLTLALLLGTNAHASRARLLGLGQDINGSLFIPDDRNVFLNPATVVTQNNRINLEAGAQDRVTGTTTNSPKAEGGITYNLGGLMGAVQLGRVSAAADRIDQQRALTAVDFFVPQNSVEVILGGSASTMNWGASIHHANSQDDSSSSNGPDLTAHVLTARGGVENKKFQAYGSVDVVNESSIETTGPNVTQSYKGNTSFEAGGSYELDSAASVGGMIRDTGYDFNDGANIKGSDQQYVLSAAYFRRFRNDENMFVFGSAGVFWSQEKVDFSDANAKDAKQEQLSLPVAIGVEKKIVSWFKVRGSATQYVLIHRNKETTAAGDHKTANLDSTVVTLGASFIYDKVALDATLKGSGNTGSGLIDGNNLMANVGMTYEF